MGTTTLGTPGIEYKSVDTQARTSEVTDLGNGMIEAIVSVTNVKDNVNDIILPGAFTKSLEKRTPKGVWHHSWTDPIAKTHEIKELMPGDPLLPDHLPDGKRWPNNAGALYVKMEFNLNTERGKTAYEDVKFFGDSQEWSIGYKVPEKKAIRRRGVREIQELELYEYSPVLFGAMPSARTATVKDAQLAYKSLIQEESTMSDVIELKDALGAFAEQFHDLVSRFADFVGDEAEEKSEDARAEVMSIVEDLELDAEDFEDFYDAVDAEDHDYAQEKAAEIVDALEGKSGIRTVTVLESLGMELKELETKPPRPKGQKPSWDDDEEDDEDFIDDEDDDDLDDIDDDEDDSDDDDDEDKPRRGRKDDLDGMEMKSISIDEFHQYLI